MAKIKITKPQRRTTRLKHYDYRQPGAYYITICTFKRMCVFGKIANNKMVLNEYGLLVNDEWNKTFELRENLVKDEFIVMPNHIHGILWINDSTSGTARRAPTFGDSLPDSLASIVGSFKSAVTRKINKMRLSPAKPVWQRNYYEHVIRKDESLDQIREYILNNPVNWATDPNNPASILQGHD